MNQFRVGGQKEMLGVAEDYADNVNFYQLIKILSFIITIKTPR
jgi:hypothetical protein